MNVVDDLIPHMRRVQSAERDLRDLSLLWQMIEAASAISCPEEAGSILPMLTQTRVRFSALQTRLVTQLAQESLGELRDDLASIAQCTIDILVRNLFERTADVGFLATDNEPASLLDLGLQFEGPGFPHAGCQILLQSLEQRLKACEINAFLAAGHFLGFALFCRGADMAQGCDARTSIRIHAKLSQQFLIPHIIADGRTLPGFGIQQRLMVKRRQQAARFFQFPQPIQPHGIEPFEYIPIFPM